MSINFGPPTYWNGTVTTSSSSNSTYIPSTSAHYTGGGFDSITTSGTGNNYDYYQSPLWGPEAAEVEKIECPSCEDTMTEWDNGDDYVCHKCRYGQ